LQIWNRSNRFDERNNSAVDCFVELDVRSNFPIPDLFPLPLYRLSESGCDNIYNDNEPAGHWFESKSDLVVSFLSSLAHRTDFTPSNAKKIPFELFSLCQFDLFIASVKIIHKQDPLSFAFTFIS